MFLENSLEGNRIKHWSIKSAECRRKLTSRRPEWFSRGPFSFSTNSTSVKSTAIYRGSSRSSYSSFDC